MPSTLEHPSIEAATEMGAHRFVWDFKRYQMVQEAGLFGNKSVELIGGELIQMPPVTLPHWITVNKCDRRLKIAFPFTYIVSVQGTLKFGESSAPLPDIAVIKADLNTLSEIPTFSVLVVEVSLSTLAYDQGEKASLYAAQGIRDYWIVNLRDNTLEVRRNPKPDAAQRHGAAYDAPQIFGRTDKVSPLELPQVAIEVADLLP